MYIVDFNQAPKLKITPPKSSNNHSSVELASKQA